MKLLTIFCALAGCFFYWPRAECTDVTIFAVSFFFSTLSAQTHKKGANKGFKEPVTSKIKSLSG